MKVAFDTNVLLDAILNRPERQEALQLMKAAVDNKIVGVISANSITDMYYLSRKGIGDQNARAAISDLMMLFDVATVDAESCATALITPMSDYEDAVLAVCAARDGADYIATRDVGFINSDRSPVKAMLPKDILAMIQNV